MRYPILLPEGVGIGAVAGSMKSGTTWLMQSLAEHPGVVSNGEIHAFERLDRFPSLVGALDQVDAFREWLMMPNNAWNLPYRNDPDETIERFTDDHFRFALEWAFAEYIDRSGIDQSRVRWALDKSPIHSTSFHESIEHYLQPYRRCIIHIVRDPRDVAISAWYHLRTLQRTPDTPFGRHLDDEDDTAACNELFELDESELTRERHFFRYPGFLRQTLESWTSVNAALHRAATAGRTPYLLIRYEDLRADLQGSLRTVGEFLELTGDEAWDAATSTDPEATGGRVWTFRKGTGGEWRRWFNEADHAIVAELCGDTMAVFEYSLD